MFKIVFTKNNSFYLFDNGKTQKIADEIKYIKKKDNFVIFVTTLGSFFYDFINNKIEKINIEDNWLISFVKYIYSLFGTNVVESNAEKYLDFSINKNRDIVYTNGQNIYLIKDSIVNLIYHEEDKYSYILSVDWIDNDNLLLKILVDKITIYPYVVIKKFNVDAKKSLILNDDCECYIVRDKYIYFYNFCYFVVVNKITGEQIRKYIINFNSIDISYDEKFAVVASYKDIIFLDIEKGEQLKYNIDVVEAKFSHDNKFLLLRTKYKELKVFDIETKSIFDFAFDMGKYNYIF